MKTVLYIPLLLSSLLSTGFARGNLTLDPILSKSLARTIVAAHFSRDADGSTAIEEGGSVNILRLTSSSISRNGQTIECRTADNIRNINSAVCTIADEYNRL